MSSPAKTYESLEDLSTKLRYDLVKNNFVLLYAYNGIGKTRLSMAFKEQGKEQGNIERDTLYFNAFTEDLFTWDNDLKNSSNRHLKLNSDSRFFNGFKDEFKNLAIKQKISYHLKRYAKFNFKIDYEKWIIEFFNGDSEYIKISRGEENIFIWCVFLAICKLTLDGAESYSWVKYFYIDDPISSLDDNNAIAVASDLAKLLKTNNGGSIKTVISSHHGLFFNVTCNELRKNKHAQYFLHKNKETGYTLSKTGNTQFFQHIVMLSELKRVKESGEIYTYHFNILRNVMEKTAVFFGFTEFSHCINGAEDKALYARALNLLSHGAYSIFDPVEMRDDNKELFKKIVEAFLENYKFNLPESDK